MCTNDQYQTFEEAQQQVFSYVQELYNNHRIQSALAYLSSVEFDKKSLTA